MNSGLLGEQLPKSSCFSHFLDPRAEVPPQVSLCLAYVCLISSEHEFIFLVYNFFDRLFGDLEKFSEVISLNSEVWVPPEWPSFPFCPCKWARCIKRIC